MVTNNVYVNEKFKNVVIGEEDLLVFFHAQRTAGSALRHVLARAYGQDKVFCTQYVDKFEHWEVIEGSRLDPFKVFAGHSNYVEKDLNKNLYYITLLRHPVFRTISLYFYCRKYKNQFLHDIAIENDLANFYRIASQKKPKYFHNVMCRRICGVTSFSDARDAIHDRFLAVGSTEKFLNFVHWFLEAQNLPHEEVPSSSPDCDRYKEYLGDSDLVAEILENNQEDEKLFYYMNEKYFGLPMRSYPWSQRILSEGV